MLRADKERIVAELASELSDAKTLIVADYRGLTNKQLEALRDQLLLHGARFRIVKNTLTRRAAERAGADALLVMLDGPTAIAFIESSGDPAAVAKALATTARETSVLTLRGGILEGKQLSGQEVGELATLPAADVLRGQVVGTIVAPLTQLVALVSGPLRDLHGVVAARIEQLEARGQVPTPEEAAELVGAAYSAQFGDRDAVTEDIAADSPSAEPADRESEEETVAAEPDPPTDREEEE